MMRHVVSVGDLVLDLITLVKLPIVPFEHQEIRSLEPQPGGAGNFMVMARRLGLRVSAVGAIGADLFGAQLRAMLESEGVEMEAVAALPGSRTTLVYALIDAERHEHAFIGYNAHGPQVMYTEAMDAVVASGDAIFMQAYNLIEQQLPAIIDPILDRGDRDGIPIFFDVGPTAKHSTIERLESVLERVNYVMMTEDEVPLAARGQTGEAAYRHLFALGVEALIIKQGPAGCTIVERDREQQVPGFPAELVDTVGAGDCFDAAFIYGYLHGYDLRRCAVLANAAGAASVQKRGGGLNVPTCGEVKAMLGDGSEINLPC
ncbi:MAG: carbohydrate kinase family protein [Aggregatilineales bacterium]